jgi:hypothetical protein
MDLAAKAISDLHTRRHAYRQLGAWSNRKPKRWRPVKTFGHYLDLAAVYADLEKLGRKAHHFRSPDLAGLIWRADSEAGADLLLQGCPTLAWGDSDSPIGPKSDIELPEEWTMPGYDDGGRGCQWTGPPPPCFWRVNQVTFPRR